MREYRFRSSFVVLGWASVVGFGWIVFLAHQFPIGIADLVHVELKERLMPFPELGNLPNDLAGELSTRLAKDVSIAFFIVGFPLVATNLGWAVLTWLLLRARGADRPLEVPREVERWN